MLTRFNRLLRSFSKSSSLGLVKLTPMDKLSMSLKEEMEIEKKNYQSIESMLIELRLKGFSISDSNGSVFVRLSKELDHKKKLVIGLLTIPVFIPPPEGSPEMAEDGTPSLKRLVSFDVSILNADLSQAIALKCMTVDFKLTTTRVTHINDVPFDSPKDVFSTSASYKGPNFGNLEESIQESFSDFLVNLGVDEDLLICITLLSFDKQKRLNFNWMKNIITMLNN